MYVIYAYVLYVSMYYILCMCVFDMFACMYMMYMCMYYVCMDDMFVYVCMCAGSCEPQRMCEGQRTTCRGWLSTPP